MFLQTGSARGLDAGRTAAAEAEQLAAWCLADRLPEAAVEALELGRGLILHAATSVAGIPDLLVTAGYAELADEWRAQPPADSPVPWDSGESGGLGPGQPAARRAGPAAGTG